jgi:signal transduction histidine kinase
MKSLRVRLTLWFTLSFVALAAIFMFFTYKALDLELRRGTFQREEHINPNWILRGSYSEAEVADIMAQLVQSSLIVSLPLVLVIIVLGYFIARKSLQPIESLNRQLKVIEPQTLGRRVELPEADEQFVSLLGHLNEMLERLERSFTDMSEYAAKVAHELRTPLTIIRYKVEQSQGRIDPDLAEELQEELLRLTRVVEQSLLIAKADQGRLAWKIEPFDLSAMLSEIISDFHLLAGTQGRAVAAQLGPEVHVESDAGYCKQIVHALLTNAFIHGRGDIKVRVREGDHHVRLVIVNLVRASPTRSELTLGLGLRLVKALIAQQPGLKFRQHHGRRYHGTSLAFPATQSTATGRLAEEAV